MPNLQRIAEWFDRRLGVRESVLPLIRHPVPPGVGWWYVFGSVTMTLLMLQLLTGVCLAMVYVPSADRAYESLEYLNYQQQFGWFLRAVHFYGSGGMVVMLLVHMTQVFLFGAYKYPRELTWIVGVGLLAFTLGMAFTGQVLRWDQDAYWGIGVGAAIAGRVPIAGPYLVDLMIGGTTIAGETLSRFFTLHVFVLPGLLLLFLGLHLYLVVRQGVSAPPVAGKGVEPATYDDEYERELERGEPFFPNAVVKDMVACGLAVVVVVLLAAIFGPYGPNGPPDPTLIHTEPRPDWPFMPVFALAALSPASLEGPMLLGLPVVAFGVLLLVPLLSSKGERSPGRRPVAVLAALTIATALGVMGWLGYKAPWSPDMRAWSGTPVPVDIVKGLEPVELQGAVVLQNKNCRNCHSLEGQGGKRGPDLDGVATRLDHDELVRQVVQGGGNMPAYGKQLEPMQIEALVAFLETLRPPEDSPARDAAKSVTVED